ncbi:MAG: hypothetical protein HY563_03100, partial [Ignavibacteriales bacterium]|nr:hypothetical protein [Ignavibacteriales bacterium]
VGDGLACNWGDGPGTTIGGQPLGMDQQRIGKEDLGGAVLGPALLRVRIRDLDHPLQPDRIVELRDSQNIGLLHGIGKSAGSCVLEFSLEKKTTSLLLLPVLYTITSG